MRVIVTDAFTHRGLCVIRSLGRKDIQVTGIVEDASLKANPHSKYCESYVILPSPDKEPDLFLENLLDLSRGYDVIIPVSTESVELLSKHLALFDHVRVPVPDYESIYRARNKELLIKLAIEKNIPTPKTYFIHDLAEVVELASKVRYPIVIKSKDEKGLGRIRYLIAHSEKELIKKYDYLHKIQEYPLIQEYIRGQGVGFFTLFNSKSEPRAVFCHKRIREFPITGGQSTFCESFRDERLIEYGLKLLKAMNWYGIAMVEFKIDNRDNEPKLMEVNPRFWGSIALPVYSGVDFPYLLVRLAEDGDIEPTMTYEEGVKLRFLFMDLIATVQYLFSSQPKKMSYLIRFIRDLFNRNVYDGIISKDDPAFTFACVTIRYIRKLPIVLTSYIRHKLGGINGI